MIIAVDRTEQRRDPRQRPHARAVGHRVSDEQRRARRSSEQNERNDAATVETVGDHAAHQHEQQRGKELGEADQPDVERVAGQVVHLLEQAGDEQHLRAPLDSVVESRYRRTASTSTPRRRRPRRGTVAVGASTSAMGSLADDTQWLDATAHAELVATRRADSDRTGRCRDRAHRTTRRERSTPCVRWFDHARESWPADDLPDGPFRGVPFLLKDLSRALRRPAAHERQRRPASGAAGVDGRHHARVPLPRGAGLVTLGRTNSPELGSVPVTEPVAYGPTRNPWNVDRVAGRIEWRERPPPSPPGWCRSPTPPTAAARSGSPPRVAGWWGSSPRQGRITLGPFAHRERPERRALRQPHGPRHGAPARRRARARRRRHRDRSAARPPVRRRGRRRPRPVSRIGLLDHHPRDDGCHADCVDAVRRRGGAARVARPRRRLRASRRCSPTRRSRAFHGDLGDDGGDGIEGYGAMLGRPLPGARSSPATGRRPSTHERDLGGVDYANGLAATVEFRRAIQQWWARAGTCC